MRTAEHTSELGLYASSCCLEEMIFGEDDCFIRCPRCERLCEWELMETLISWAQMEDVEEQAA